MTTQPLQLFAEITRLDEDARIVEGYAYTGPRVKSDPYHLSFDVLRAASEDYLRWANVREMHDTKAAGNCLALEFQEPEQRIFIRAEISDDQAWRKVKSKTYKGFSIGGRPTLLRGTEVLKFQWTETSLVDRPADPGATITLFRRDDVPADAAEEAPAEVERAGSPKPDYAAGDAGPTLPVPEENETEASRLAGSLHYDCGATACHGHKQHAAAQRCSLARVERGEGVYIPDEATDEEAALIGRTEPAPPASDGVDLPDPTPAADAAPTPATTDEELDEMTTAELTTRMDALAAENAALLARLDALPTGDVARLESALTETQDTLKRLETERAAMAAEIKRLGDQPAGAPVVRFPGALTREIVQRHGEANLGADLVKKVARYEELKAAVPATDTQAQNKQVEEMLDLTRELRANGIQV